MIRAKRTSINVKNKRVWNKTEGRCWYCGTMLIKPDPNGHKESQRQRWYTIDHATPRSRGGTNDLHNLLPSCGRCNEEKDSMTVEEYRQHVILTQPQGKKRSGLGFRFYGEKARWEREP